MTVAAEILVEQAHLGDADAIATVHLTARAQALPWLRPVHTAGETRQHFATIVAREPQFWWVVRLEGAVVAYMRARADVLDDLYVLPRWQGQGVGSALLAHAKALGPSFLRLWTFQRNARARAFYEARGFRSLRFTGGDNEEGEPDVLYEWRTG